MIKTEARETHCQNCITTNCFIKMHCTEEYIAKISETKETSIYRKNQYIAQQGNTVIGLFFIKEGKAKIISRGIDQRTQLVRLTVNGDIIGHRGYGGEKYPISAIAIEESAICLIDNDTIYAAFMDNPKLSYALMIYYSEELRKSESKMKCQAQMNVREKVANALIYCNNSFNTKSQYPFNIILNRQDLADLAGINTEQLSRILSEFKNDNVLSLSKNMIFILQVDVLNKLLAPFGI